MVRSAASSLTCFAALAALAACSDVADKRVALVRVEPLADPNCGAPAEARTMIVRGLGDFAPSESSAQSIALGEEASFAIDRFPVTTEVLEVEVLGLGGATRTIGRTGVFDLESLDADAEIAVFMAPPLGVCPTGPQVQTRRNALLARAGDAVLLVGGLDGEGTALSTAERYQPDEGTFVRLDDTLYGGSSPSGLQGASLTTLGNGNVALVGGGATAFQVFNIGTGGFGAPAFYREARARHAAVAVGGDRVFVAGGCSQVLSAGCADGSELRTSSILDTASGELEAGPSLQLSRIDGSAYVESALSVVLVGGEGPDGQSLVQAERVFFDGRSSQILDGLGGASVQSESGAIWMGMAGAGGVVSRDLALLAPGESSVSFGLAAAMEDSSVNLTSLQDGSLLALGSGGAQRIRTLDGASELLNVPAIAGMDALQTIRLHDGSVLILGERAGGSEAFVFRPSLVGPYTASATATFSSVSLSEGLSASDATRVQRVAEGGDHLELAPGPEGEAYLIVAGPVLRDFALETGLSAQAGEVTLIFGWQSQAEHWKIALQSGNAVRLYHVEGGVAREAGGCSAKMLAAAALGGDRLAHEVRAYAQSGQLRVLLDAAEVLTCDVEEFPAGQVGLGFASQDSEVLRIDIITLGR